MAASSHFDDLEIHMESGGDFVAYGEVPIAFEVSSIFDIVPKEGGLALAERRLEAAYLKDYDDCEEDRPASWPQRFDTRHWMAFSAWESRRRIAGMAVAWKTPALNLVPYRDDRAILWDVRVAPQARGKGVGSRMLQAVKTWAGEQVITELVVETQNINVPACRFYASQGFELLSIRPFAYADLPDEVQLLWRLKLD